MKNTLALSSAAVALLLTSVASAAVFDFAYDITASGPFPTAVTASGTLTADPTATPGQFLVTAISGTRNGETITSLIPPGGYEGNDNLIFTTAPHLDFNGLSYTVMGVGDDGLGDVNVFFSPPPHVHIGYTEELRTVGYTPTFTLTLVSIPEPSTWALMALGFAGLGFAAFRRSTKQRLGAA
jgi:hypothetical protein